MTKTSKSLHQTVVVLAGILLAGCVSTSPLAPVVAEPDIVSTRIAQSAEKASAALDALASIEQARAPAMPEPTDYSLASPALMQLITVKWAGPAEQMAKALAERAGMGFQVVGNQPSVPLLVTVDAYQKPLIEVLEDIGLQAGRRADVSVNSSNNMIEIRYAPVDRY